MTFDEIKKHIETWVNSLSTELEYDNCMRRPYSERDIIKYRVTGKTNRLIDDDFVDLIEFIRREWK